MKNSSRFFRNTFLRPLSVPSNADPETFNCLFCYCPLYFLPECIGTPRWNANGIKDCTSAASRISPTTMIALSKSFPRRYANARRKGKEKGASTGPNGNDLI